MTDPKKSILILGGGRYFGKRLFHILLDKGHNVTILNRNQTELERVKGNKIIGDREDPEVIAKLGKEKWDVIFDQICLSQRAAELGKKFLLPSCHKYVLTSSRAVYLSQSKQKEDDFNATLYLENTFLIIQILTRS